jgi:hypothetical protein
VLLLRPTQKVDKNGNREKKSTIMIQKLIRCTPKVCLAEPLSRSGFVTEKNV